jgi:hypothetical protein
MAKPVEPKKPAAAPAPSAKSKLTLSATDARALMEAQAAKADQPRPTAPVPIAPIPVTIATPPVPVAAVVPASELIAENLRLANAHEAAVKDSEQAIAAAQKAMTELRQAEAKLATRSEEFDKLTAKFGAVQADLKRARAEIEQLTVSQPTKDGPTVLTAESVANLLSEFVGQFDGKVGALILGSGEVALKVGFTATGGKAAFVLPSATAPQDGKEVFHDVRLQLNPRVQSG